VEVIDRGRSPSPSSGAYSGRREQCQTGRGLWVGFNQLCDLTQIRSNAAGSVVRLTCASADVRLRSLCDEPGVDGDAWKSVPFHSSYRAGLGPRRPFCSNGGVQAS